MPRRIRMTVPLRRVWLWTLSPLVGIPSLPLALDAAVSFAMALLIAFRVNRACRYPSFTPDVIVERPRRNENVRFHCRHVAKMPHGRTMRPCSFSHKSNLQD